MEYSKNYITKMGVKVWVRNAVALDAEAVTELSNQNYQDSPFLSKGPADPGDTVEGTRSYIENLSGAKREAFLVAMMDGQIVGSAHLDGCGSRRKMHHRCEIAMGVKKDLRNKGVGHCLMDALLSLAKGAHYEQVECNVIENNVLGVALYKAHGFEVTGKLPHAYKYSDDSYGDYLFMVRYL